MNTNEQTPWVEYLEINEKTGKRKLKKHTPKEIKKMYKLYLKENKKSNKKHMPIFK